MLEITPFEENRIKEKFKEYNGEKFFSDYMIYLEVKFSGKKPFYNSLESQELYENEFRMEISDEKIKKFIKNNR